MPAKAPHYNSIFRYLESEALTPVIQGLVAQSAVRRGRGDRLRRRFDRLRKVGILPVLLGQVQARRKRGADRPRWLKVPCHGRRPDERRNQRRHSRPATPIAPSSGRSWRPPHFAIAKSRPTRRTASHTSLTPVDALGATPYIPFKFNAAPATGPPALEQALSLLLVESRGVRCHYHKRCDVEATFSAIKRVFGERPERTLVLRRSTKSC